jgi:hypothetical protein
MIQIALSQSNARSASGGGPHDAAPTQPQGRNVPHWYWPSHTKKIVKNESEGKAVATLPIVAGVPRATHCKQVRVQDVPQEVVQPRAQSRRHSACVRVRNWAGHGRDGSLTISHDGDTHGLQNFSIELAQHVLCHPVVLKHIRVRLCVRLGHTSCLEERQPAPPPTTARGRSSHGGQPPGPQNPNGLKKKRHCAGSVS